MREHGDDGFEEPNGIAHKVGGKAVRERIVVAHDSSVVDIEETPLYLLMLEMRHLRRMGEAARLCRRKAQEGRIKRVRLTNIDVGRLDVKLLLRIVCDGLERIPQRVGRKPLQKRLSIFKFVRHLGKWEVGSGEWGVGSGEWGVGSGEWEVGSGEWEVGWGKKFVFTRILCDISWI